MKSDCQKIPPADQPDWGGPYNWAWFKYHHFETLEKNYKVIDNQYKRRELGKGYTQRIIAKFLHHVDILISLYDWLPNSGGGQMQMDELIRKRKDFEIAYLNKEINDMSYWHAQEMISCVFTIYNYMQAMCDEE